MSVQLQGLSRTLQRRHMQMIALGGVIGAGLFVGSGVVVQAIGPAAVVSFALTGTLGVLAGFLTGWMYWYYWVIVVAMEAVAGAKLLDVWFPAVAPWILTLSLILVFTAINLFSVRSWGEFEYWFASIKVAAITVFLVAGVAYILGLWPHPGPGFTHLVGHGGFLPNGVVPVLTGAVAATGFYFGAELVTVAAAESEEPEQTVAQATQSVVSRVLVFYVGSIFIVVTLVPWNSAAMAQPYVSVLRELRIPGGAAIMNGVILT